MSGCLLKGPRSFRFTTFQIKNKCYFVLKEKACITRNSCYHLDVNYPPPHTRTNTPTETEPIQILESYRSLCEFVWYVSDLNVYHNNSCSIISLVRGFHGFMLLGSLLCRLNTVVYSFNVNNKYAKNI